MQLHLFKYMYPIVDAGLPANGFGVPDIYVSEGDIGNAIDSGMGLSITIDKLRVFINKTLSILSAYQQLVDSR